MIVRELIGMLGYLPSDMLVLVNGYEGGFCEPKLSEPTPIELDVNDSSVYGPHDKPGDGEVPSHKVVNAVILQRTVNGEAVR